MADNNTLPKVGGTFISRMKEVAAGIFTSIPILGNPTTGDPIPLGRDTEAAGLPFALDEESFALLTTLNSNMALLAGVLAAFGGTATAAAPELDEGAVNQPLSVDLSGGLRMVLTDGLGGVIDGSLPAPIYFDVPGPQAPRLEMATNTSAQAILAAGGSGVFYDLVGWKVYNPAGGSTVLVQIIDDAAGANVVVDELVVAAGAQDGYVFANVPTEQLAANKAWSVKMPSAVAGVIVKAWFTTRT